MNTLFKLFALFSSLIVSCAAFGGYFMEINGGLYFVEVELNDSEDDFEYVGTKLVSLPPINQGDLNDEDDEGHEYDKKLYISKPGQIQYSLEQLGMLSKMDIFHPL